MKKLKSNIEANYTGVFVLILIFVYLFLALIKLKSVGIQYDELLFGNAALGNTGDLAYSFHKIPILILQYIGALKAYIYYPIFKILGVSVFSVRLPMIFLTVVALYFFFKTISSILNKKNALIALALLVTDASFVLQTRYDVGPVVLEFFLKIMVLFYFFKFIKNSKNIYILIIGGLLLLGVFNKLNFIWFINSFMFSSIIVYWAEIKNIFLKSSKKLKIVFLSEVFIIVTACLGYFFILNNLFKLFDPLKFLELFHRLISVMKGFRGLIDGTSFYNYALGEMNLPINYVYYIFILIVLVAGLLSYVYTWKYKKGVYQKEYLYFVLIFLTVFIQIFLTKNATALWHTYTLYPFITILVTLSIYNISFIISNKIIKKWFAGVFFVIVLIYQFFMFGQYIKSYSQSTRDIGWSSEIYNLIEYTENSNRDFIIIDWGMYNQLLTFNAGRDKDKYLEKLWWLIGQQTSKEEAAFSKQFLLPENKYLFIMHGKEQTIFQKARENFFRIVTESGLSAKLIEKFVEGEKVVYEIYIIEK